MASHNPLALTTMTAEAGCLPCQQRAAANHPRSFADVAPEIATPPTSMASWSGVIGVEGELTGDGRLIEKNALSWSDLPLPLRYVSNDVGAHDGAQVVGRITSITRGQHGAIEATGDFDTSSAIGLEAQRQVAEGLTTGVSMDLDSVSFEIRVAADVLDAEAGFPLLLADTTTEPEPPVTDAEGRVTVAQINADDEVSVTTSGRIRAATIVAIPAFSRANIAMMAANPSPPKDGKGTPPPAGGGGTDGVLPDGSTPCSCDDTADDFDPDCDCSQALAAETVSDKPWSDFTQADYTDQQWFDATVLHTNGDSKAKADNGLPIREPSGTLNRNGVHNAAARFNQVKAPPEAKAKAAAALRGAYDTLGEDPPDVIAKAAADTLVAAAAPVDPPGAWFNDPHFSQLTPLTITADGRVYGHIAEWGACHASHTAPGQCTTPPHSASGYARFHYGAVLTAEGAEIAVGHLTLDTRHAGDKLTPANAAAHYENTGTVAADVRAGEDGFGVWVAGALRPELSPEKVRALRSAPISGDWRRYGMDLELVAALAVNVPGFGIPRPQGMVAGGVLTSLVASGMVAPRKVRPPGADGALSVDDLRYLKRLIARERAEEQTLRASGSLPAATDLARRVRASTLAMRAHKG